MLMFCAADMAESRLTISRTAANFIASTYALQTTGQQWTLSITTTAQANNHKLHVLTTSVHSIA